MLTQPEGTPTAGYGLSRSPVAEAPWSMASRPRPFADTLDTNGLSLTIEHPTGTYTVVRVAGEIDMLTAPDLRACLTEQLAARPQQLVLNLAAVTFAGSHTLAILVGAKTIAENGGTKLYLTGVNTVVRRLLDVTGLTATFSDDPPPPGLIS